MSRNLLAAQRGRLTYEFPDVIGVVIPAAVKWILLEMLDRNFGFNRETIFPDFSGMGEFYSEQRT